MFDAASPNIILRKSIDDHAAERPHNTEYPQVLENVGQREDTQDNIPAAMKTKLHTCNGAIRNATDSDSNSFIERSVSKNADAPIII